jgi:hypothetical protein
MKLFANPERAFVLGRRRFSEIASSRVGDRGQHVGQHELPKQTETNRRPKRWLPRNDAGLLRQGSAWFGAAAY